MSYAPCKDCKNRHPNCHSLCKEYKEFREEQQFADNNRKAFYRSYYPSQRFFDEMARRNRRNKKNK